MKSAQAFTMRTTLVSIGLTMAVLAVFGGIIAHDFLRFEDAPYIENNPIVNGSSGWNTFKLSFLSAPENNWIPLTWLFMALQFMLAGGEAWIFRLSSIAMHTATGVLLWLFLQKHVRPWAALIAVLLFLLHPLRVEPVAWASSQKDLLAGMLIMASLLTFPLRPSAAANRLRFRASLALFCLSLLAKQSGVAFPLFLLLLIQSRGSSNGKDIAYTSLFLVPSMVAGIAAILAQSTSNDLWSWTDHSLTERLELMFVSFAWLGQRLILPQNLAPEYIPPTESLLYLISGLVIAMTTALFAWKYRHIPLFSIGLVGTLILFLPFSGILAGPVIFTADRHTYIPAITLSIALAAAISAFPPKHAKFLIALLAITFIPMAWCSLLQVSKWQDDRTILETMLEVNAANPVALQNLGVIELEEENPNRALDLWASGHACDPSNPEIAWNLATLQLQLGKNRDASTTARTLTNKRPQLPIAWHLRGHVAEAMGEFSTAANHYQTAFALDPKALKSAAAALRCLHADGDQSALDSWWNQLNEPTRNLLQEHAHQN